MTHKRQLGRDEKVVGRVVPVALLTEKDLLAALSNYTKGRFGPAMKLLGRG
jgi:hypothetical protein